MPPKRNNKKRKTRKKRNEINTTEMKSKKKMGLEQKRKLKSLITVNFVNSFKAEQKRKALIPRACEAPYPRRDFSIVAHPCKDELILFGGAVNYYGRLAADNELYFYNINCNQWRRWRRNVAPISRWNHQMVALPTESGGQLWLFGGEWESPFHEYIDHFKDLWYFDLTTCKWQRVDAPNGPCARSGHCMVVANKRIIIFGGSCGSNMAYMYLNDVHMFSLESYSWLKFIVDDAIIPSPRSSCYMSATPDGTILLWGGFASHSHQNSIYVGEFYDDMFSFLPSKFQEGTYFWNAITPGRLQPKQCSGVAYSVANNWKVYCFGGINGNSVDKENNEILFNNDLVEFDLTNKTWRVIEESKACNIDKSANIPVSRISPGLVAMKEKLYLYGGIYEDTERQFVYNDLYEMDLKNLNEWKILIPQTVNQRHIDWSEEDSSGSDDDCEM